MRRPRVGVLICVLQFSKEKNTTHLVSTSAKLLGKHKEKPPIFAVFPHFPSRFQRTFPPHNGRPSGAPGRRPVWTARRLRISCCGCPARRCCRRTRTMTRTSRPGENTGGDGEFLGICVVSSRDFQGFQCEKW